MKSSFATSTRTGRTFYDYGCGDGRIAVRLAADGARKVTGFDVSPRARSRQPGGLRRQRA